MPASNSIGLGCACQSRCGDRTDPDRPAVGRLQLGMLGFEGLELAEEVVVLSIRYSRAGPPFPSSPSFPSFWYALDLLAQGRHLLRWRHGCDNNSAGGSATTVNLDAPAIVVLQVLAHCDKFRRNLS